MSSTIGLEKEVSIYTPAGATKNGTTEAALIGSEAIVHNKNITQLLDNFSGKWIRIK